MHIQQAFKQIVLKTGRWGGFDLVFSLFMVLTTTHKILFGSKTLKFDMSVFMMK